MSKAYGYIRVSREEQVESGLSLEAQEQTARGFWEPNLKAKGLEWGGLWVDEAVSAFSRALLRRPSGNARITRIYCIEAELMGEHAHREGAR